MRVTACLYDAEQPASYAWRLLACVSAPERRELPIETIRCGGAQAHLRIGLAYDVRSM